MIHYIDWKLTEELLLTIEGSWQNAKNHLIIKGCGYVLTRYRGPETQKVIGRRKNRLGSSQYESDTSFTQSPRNHLIISHLIKMII